MSRSSEHTPIIDESRFTTVPLKFVADVSISNVDKHTMPNEQAVLLCNSGDVFANEFISKHIEFMPATASANQVEKFLLHEGDVLLAKDSLKPDRIGIPSLVIDSIEDLVCGYHIAILKPRPDRMTPGFLLRLLQSAPVNAHFVTHADGVTIAGLSEHTIAHTPIPLPPPSEQRLIANFLDCESGKADELIRKYERLMKLLEEKRIALITKALTQGLDPAASVKDSGIEWIGKIPTGWSARTLARSAKEIKTGPFGSVLHAEDYIEGGVPVVNPANIADGRMVPDNEITVDGPTLTRLSEYRLAEGDVIIGRRGEMGRAAVVSGLENGWLCGTGCMKITPEPRYVLSDYLGLYLNSYHAKQWLSYQSLGSTMDNLNPKILGQYRLALPPTQEQRRIIQYIKTESASVEGTIAKCRRAVGLTREHLAALITAAVTGQIDVSNYKVKRRVEVPA